MINKRLLPLIVAIATVFTLFGTACSKVPEEPVKENNNSAPETDIKDEKPEIPVRRPIPIYQETAHARL